MLQVHEAQKRMIAEVQPLGVERLSLPDAAGRILAGPHTAQRNLPPWDNSAMDGFAVRAEDLKSASNENPTRLKVIGEVACGDVAAAGPSVTTGTAVRINTGAPVPAGANAVVIKEQVRLQNTDDSLYAQFTKPVPLQANVRFAGEDVAAGITVGDDGQCITPARLSLLASAGFSQVDVYQKPKIAILASGSELVPLGQQAAPHQIINSNAHAVAAALKAAGASVRILGIARDTLDDHVAHFNQVAEDEWAVSIGGVSMGEKDWVRPALEQLGADQLFWKVAMRPGKPLVFAKKGAQLFVGLPGNPVSALVGTELFLKPMVRQAQNRHKVFKTPVWGELMNDDAVTKRKDFATYFRAKVNFGTQPPQVLALSKQSSGQISGLAEANALMITPVGPERIEKGSAVQVLPFS